MRKRSFADRPCTFIFGFTGAGQSSTLNYFALDGSRIKQNLVTTSPYTYHSTDERSKMKMIKCAQTVRPTVGVAQEWQLYIAKEIPPIS